ncbi:hypothetical protein LTR15_010294 [Elasticomyces elasticus]|nr:hypothetical protein LTR15_010294 [Elasticomyces elasticus]
MAETATMPSTNGYAPHQGYDAYNSTPAPYQQPQSQDTNSSSNPQPDIPKDEVGWYFVEQYYTTLSRSPEKLYLFYNKRSQFVSGQETDKVPVCVGQRAINDRIKELEFQDCKVRVTNVDSQASDANIVIQVIGEISNKGNPHKKFTQTFVLAAQTNGYFVLNDIFRYLVEEEDEEQPAEADASVPAAEEVQQTPAAETAAPEPEKESEKEPLTNGDHVLSTEPDVEAVDKELQEKVVEAEEAPAALTNGDAAAEEPESNHVEEKAEDAAAPATTTEDSQPEVPTVSEPEPAAKEEVAEPEKPKDPSPSPAVTPAAPKAAPQQPAAPPKPSAPKTWASLAASANRVATPAAPQQQQQQKAPAASKPQQPSPAPAAAQTSAPAPAPANADSTQAAPSESTPITTPSQPREANNSASQDEWVAVQGHNRQQSRQAEQQGGQQMGQNRGYIKNVHEGIDFKELEERMKQFGELEYFDIARQKSCAFVDFATPRQYQAAVAANPHVLGANGDKLYVEERRVRPGTVPFIPRGGPYGRGGRGNGRGGPGGAPQRGDFNGPRGGGGRGSFGPGPRGGAAPRGRGAPQA